MLREFFFDLLPSYLERIVLGIGACIGYVWALAFDSKKGANGLIKKFIILWLCALAHGLDVIIGITIIQQVFVGAFGLNEMMSIIENVGRVHPGLVPQQVQSFLERLKNRTTFR